MRAVRSGLFRPTPPGVGILPLDPEALQFAVDQVFEELPDRPRITVADDLEPLAGADSFEGFPHSIPSFLGRHTPQIDRVLGNLDGPDLLDPAADGRAEF